LANCDAFGAICQCATVSKSVKCRAGDKKRAKNQADLKLECGCNGTGMVLERERLLS